MTEEQAVKVCSDYGLTTDELRIAGAVELLQSNGLTSAGSVSNLVSKLDSVLDAQELASAIKWATWVKYARKNGLDGVDAKELMEIREEDENG